MDMSVASMMVMALWMYTYPQTCQVVYVRYVHLFKCQSYLNKVFFFFFNLSEEKNFWSPGTCSFR